MKRAWIILSASAIALIGLALAWLVQTSPRSIPATGPPNGVAIGEDRSIRWHRAAPFRRLRGVALAVHGLNLNPERMEFLISQLNRAGIEVLNLSLHGHGENYCRDSSVNGKEARLESFRSVTYDLWSAELYTAYLKVQNRSRLKRVPLFLIGYSLGGLLGCELQVSRPGVRFDRMVLFAPALRIVAKPYLLKALVPFPNFVVDSLSPEAYRTNDGTPMAGYKALFKALGRFEENMNGRLNVPTIVFMDRDDEFIPFDQVQAMIVEGRLDRWRMVAVEKDPSAADRYAHHLLIDETVVGKVMWSRMQAELLAHLAPDQRRTSRFGKR